MCVWSVRNRYLEWLVGYQFPVLTQFFAKVEDLVMTVGAADVTYHEPKRNLEATLKRQGDMKVCLAMLLLLRFFLCLPQYSCLALEPVVAQEYISFSAFRSAGRIYGLCGQCLSFSHTIPLSNTPHSCFLIFLSVLSEVQVIVMVCVVNVCLLSRTIPLSNTLTFLLFLGAGGR